MEMSRILPRILLLYKILNSFLLTLIPKDLRSLFPTSWYDDGDEPDDRPTSSSSDPSLTIRPSPLVKTDPPASTSSPPTTKAKTRTIAPTTTTTSCSDPGGEVTALTRRQQSGTDAAELRKVFRMFDGNGDGKITNEELKESLESMGMSVPESELAQMITGVDANGDGCVDIDEFRVLYDTIIQRGEKDGGEEEEEEEEDDTAMLMNAFGVFDKNGDGFISMEELGSVLCSLGLGQGGNVEDCRKMIMKVDVDGDGRVSFEEFKCMMRDCCFAAAC